MQINYNYNSGIDNEVYTNLNTVLRLIRPDVTKEGDKLRVKHRGEEYVIPMTRYTKVTTLSVK